MKSIFYICTILFLICGVVLVQGDVAQAVDMTALSDNEAGIIAVSGDVKIVTPTGVRKDAKVGDRIKNGTKIITGAKSHAQIAYSPDLKKSILIREKTKAVVTPLGDIKMSVDKGDVYAILDKVKPGRKFRFETPHAISGVRGTRPRLQVMIETTILSVAEGKMDVFSLGFDPEFRSQIAAGVKGIIDASPDKPIFTEKMSEQEMNLLNVILFKMMRKEQDDYKKKHGNKFIKKKRSHLAPPSGGSGGGGKVSGGRRHPLADIDAGPSDDGFQDPTGWRMMGSDQHRGRDVQQPTTRQPEPTRDTGGGPCGGPCP